MYNIIQSAEPKTGEASPPPAPSGRGTPKVECAAVIVAQ
jgi:hypothetical protein